MVRLRSNVMTIFVASALVLFMSPVKSAFAHAASPAVAKAFSTQEPQKAKTRQRPRTSRTTLRRVQTPT